MQGRSRSRGRGKSKATFLFIMWCWGRLAGRGAYAVVAPEDAT